MAELVVGQLAVVPQLFLGTIMGRHLNGNDAARCLIF